MPFDAFVLRCIAGELEDKLVCARAKISKIYQPDPNELLLHFRGKDKNYALLLSVNASRARIHLTARHFQSPPSPSPFCMLLRKHLSGASLTNMEQLPLERVIKFQFRALNLQGREVKITLVAEIMERRSNLILLDEPNEDGKEIILGAIRAVPPFMNRFRTILPHHPYQLPPSQNKFSPFAADYNLLAMEAAREKGKQATEFLLEKLQGISPFLAREVAARAGTNMLSAEAWPELWQALQKLLLIYSNKQWEPTMLCDSKGEPLDYAPFLPVQAYGMVRRQFSSMSELLDEFHLHKEKIEAKKQLQQLIIRQVGQNIAKARKKESMQLAELENAEKSDYYRLCGELLKSNFHAVPEKSGAVYLPNIYSKEAETVKILLEPNLSLSENVQRYFKKYRKAANASKKITASLTATRQEINYLEGVLYCAEKSDWQELHDIRRELEEEGYLPRPPKPPAQGTLSASKPLSFSAAGGEKIFVGRNNRQNELLLRLANPDDLWFHVKDMPGAHVILQGTQPGKEGIEAAAMLAVIHSRSAHSANVPVDYTQVRHLRRIPGAKPGMVTYTGQRTISITPDHNKLQGLLKR